jgi:hypothetical protein
MTHSLVLNPPKKLEMIFQILKIWQNGQFIKFAAGNKHPHICLVQSAYKIFL